MCRHVAPREGQRPGREVRGIDLANGLDDESYREVRAAFLQFGVLFFKEQSEIAPAVQIAIGRMFGVTVRKAF